MRKNPVDNYFCYKMCDFKNKRLFKSNNICRVNFEQEVEMIFVEVVWKHIRNEKSVIVEKFFQTDEFINQRSQSLVKH